MIKSRIAVAGALLAVAGAANAGFTVTPTITSDYDFRGLTQTDKDPAFQLGATYAFENGFYAGVWGSNVDFGAGDPNVELDYSVGFTGGDASETFGYDIGAVYYTYVNAGSGNTLEVYAGLSKDWFSAKLWIAPEVANSSDSAVYVEANAAYPLPQDFQLLGHVGYSFGDFWKNNASEYTDYSIGVGKNFGAVNVNVKYVDGSDNLDNRVIVSASTTLPWAK
jgi:uncharacterized protein (TIGR02001 family)